MLFLQVSPVCCNSVGGEGKAKMMQKSTDEIRKFIRNAKLDFDSVENKALNDYLPKIFNTCPFTTELCTTKQCIGCPTFMKHSNKQNLEKKE
jgi:hypothetical protein